MITIAICNQKGGIGKTTTAHAIGAGLAARGRRVLTIDLDPQCNLTFAAGASDGGVTAYEILMGAAAAADAIQHGGIIASSAALAGADLAITQTGKEYRLREALESLAGLYDCCVLDTPPALGILTVNALTAADGIIIPAQADVFSLRAIQQLSGTITAVKRYCNPALTVYGILLTRYNGRSILSREVTEAMRGAAETLGARVFDVRIRECVALREAQAQGQDIFAYAPNSNAALDYAALLDELESIYNK